MRLTVSTKIATVSSLLLLSLTVSPSAIRARQGGHASVSPVQTVQRFYRAHFASNKRFTPREIKKKRQWLAPELFDLLVAEANKKYPADTVPEINGDPFTSVEIWTMSRGEERGGIDEEKERIGSWCSVVVGEARWVEKEKRT